MFVNFNNGATENPALLISPNVKNSAASCRMKFWYHLDGSGMNDKVGNIDGFVNVGDEKTKSFSIANMQGNLWHPGTIYIGRYRTEFTITLESMKAPKTDGDIAVDDISFTGN